jgi:riboflavin kinase / FMN adenylyltransferase
MSLEIESIVQMIVCRRPTLQTRPTVVTMGNFDGVHLGHQALLNQTRSLAKSQQLNSCLLMFEPYPQAFFHPERNIPRLTTLREKMFVLSAFEIDMIYALPFNAQISNYSPHEFIDKILLQQLQAQAIVVGEDFHFGHLRAGNVSTLQAIKQFTTYIVPPAMIEGLKISSTRIRNHLQNSDLDNAKALLGHDYFMIGKVVKGDKRGRKLGFPTANISLKKRLPPIRGVYAVKVYGAMSEVLTGVANIGTRPTVDGAHPVLEVHIFDFTQEIYGKYLRVEFINKIRDEKRFTSLDELSSQIAKDVAIARECFH